MVLYQSRHDAIEYGRLAQLVEHLLDVQEVTGSSPVPSTKRKPLTKVRGFLLRLPLSHVRAGRYRTRTAAEPTATTTSAASGGSSEELLGPRPAIRKQGAADAGCRNPSACGGNREARLGPRSDFSRPRQGAAEKSANATRQGRAPQLQLLQECLPRKLRLPEHHLHCLGWAGQDRNNVSQSHS